MSVYDSVFLHTIVRGNGTTLEIIAKKPARFNELQRIHLV